MNALSGTYVSTGEVTGLVFDTKWTEVFGKRVLLPRATEVEVVAGPSEHVLVGVRDIYFPRVDLLLDRAVFESAFKPSDAGQGSRSRGAVQECRHRNRVRNNSGCLACFRRWWMRRAGELGIDYTLPKGRGVTPAQARKNLTRVSGGRLL